jgi:hypothetical protein
VLCVMTTKGKKKAVSSAAALGMDISLAFTHARIFDPRGRASRSLSSSGRLAG